MLFVDNFVRTFSVVALLIMLIAPMSSSGDEMRSGAGGFFSDEEIYSSRRSLTGGMDSGDPDHDGDLEVAFCDFEGNVMLLEPTGSGGFEPNFIWQVEGTQGSNRTLFDLVIHDLDPDRPGVEIVTAGDVGPEGEKDVFLLSYDGSKWTTDIIYSSPFKTFDIEIGDIDPAQGDEIILSSFQHEEDLAIRYLCRSDDGWIAKEIPTIEAPKAVTVADADPNIPGKEVYATLAGWSDEGIESHLAQYFNVGDQWEENIIYTHPSELIANVKAGDLWSGHDGNELIITELSGWCRYFYYDGTEFQMENIFQADTISGSPSGLEGLTIGDFNPLHDGDEAMVTGYYNKVTQIIESDGELIADLAWEKEVDNPRMEINGVEVCDVLSDHEGNEVLVASLQGWIQLLAYEEDGIVLEATKNEIDLFVGGTAEIDLTIRSRGMYTGPVMLSAEPYPGLSIDIPILDDLEQQETREFTVDIEALEDFEGPSEVELTFTAVSGSHSSSVDIMVNVNADVQLIITPQVGTLYKEGGVTHISKLSLLNAYQYDYLEISTGEVEGMEVHANTPISPGQEQEITINVRGDPKIGSYSIPITASYSGITVSQGSIVIEMVSLAESFESSVREVTGEKNMYLAEVSFHGPREINMVNVDIWVGDHKVYSDGLDFSVGETFTQIFSLDEYTEGLVRIELSTLAGSNIRSDSFMELEYVPDEKQEDSPALVFIAASIVVVLIIVLLLLLIFYKPTPEDKKDGELQDIGSPSRYKAGKGPLGPRKVPITGKLDRPRSGKVFHDIDEREKNRRGNVRRAPPRPRSMGEPPRDVRRAPPRRRF
ncbi:MAG: hypothetical protein R6V01_03230 [Thermoplasmatota archaeon]